MQSKQTLFEKFVNPLALSLLFGGTFIFGHKLSAFTDYLSTIVTYIYN